MNRDFNTLQKVVPLEYKNTSTVIESARFSKNEHVLYSAEDKKNIDLGLKLHSLFENIDLLNPDYTGISDFYKDKIQGFIDTGILDNCLKLYKEYEFIYIYNDKKYHGFIDLLIEYDDYYTIVDYKLKNTTSDAYKKQLNGYKEYIGSLTGKPVKTYLYSILDNTLTEID